MLVDRFLIGPPSNPPLLRYAEGPNTGIGYFQKQREDSGAALVTNTSGTLVSGVYPPNYGNNTGAEYAGFPNQQDGVIPDIQDIVSGVIPGTNISGCTKCSGAFVNNYEEITGTGYTIIPNQPDVIQPNTHNEVTTGTNISDAQCSGFYCSSHFETGFIPLEATPVHIPLSYQIPTNYIPQFNTFYPLPSELSGFNLGILIMDMSGRQFEAFFLWVSPQLGYKTTQYKKTHDRGGDILQVGFGEIIINQLKHRKEHTGRRALEEVLYAKENVRSDQSPGH